MNGESQTSDVYRTLKRNRRWPIDWSYYFRLVTPNNGDFHFRSDSATLKIDKNS
jgi:hypothetical protein